MFVDKAISVKWNDVIKQVVFVKYIITAYMWNVQEAGDFHFTFMLSYVST